MREVVEKRNLSKCTEGDEHGGSGRFSSLAAPVSARLVSSTMSWVFVRTVEELRRGLSTNTIARCRLI